jgi:hypothetical protein
MALDTGLNPLAVTFPTAKRLSSLGLTTLWKLAKERRIEVVRVGRRTLIVWSSLEKLLTPESADQPARCKRSRPRKGAEAVT